MTRRTGLLIGGAVAAALLTAAGVTAALLPARAAPLGVPGVRDGPPRSGGRC